MSAVFESLLNHTFTVVRRDRVSDGQGGWGVVWADMDPVKGRIRPATSAEREIALQEGRTITHVLYVVAGADIARGDRLEVESVPAYDEVATAHVYDVLGVREPSLAGHHLEVDCLERQKEVDVEEGS